MSNEIMVIIIVAIVVSGVVRLARIASGTERQGRKHRRGAQALLDPAEPSPREIELQREVEDLRERIHVLERIATDGRQTHALAAEIESLRER
jgi:Sec-independent protein translocase protein TatA